MSSPLHPKYNDRNDSETTIVRQHLDPNATALHDGSVPFQTSGFVAGSRLNGNFRLEKQLGRGGMGEAWKAYDETADRYVVLKFIPKEVQHIQAAVDSVRDSFRKVHELQHQHICPVYGLFTDPDHGLYLAMKFIDGVPLDEYKQKRIEKSGKMSFSDAVQILWGIAKGLDYAHEKKVIHRDIKPQNVMISKKDGVQIIDFGLAEEIRTSMAKFSEVVMEVSGTRPYMAPEQWMGRMQDARTDQYALAVTAYELFAGHPPFMGSDVGILRECVLNDEPEPIPNLPEHVNAALAKALAKKRDDRFENCKAFVKALAEKPKTETADPEMQISVVPSLLSDRAAGVTAPPIWVPPVSTSNSSTKKPLPSRKTDHRLLVVGVVAVCVVLLGLGGLFLGKPTLQPNVTPPPKSETAKKTKPVETEKTEPIPKKEPAPDLSKLADAEKRELQQEYPEIDWKDANVVVLSKPTKDALNQAFFQASETKSNDIVVVRTTKDDRRLVLDGDPFTVQHKATEKGSVTFIALGPAKLVLDGDKKNRLFIVKDGAEVSFGGISFTNGQIVDRQGGGVYVGNNSTARFIQCDFVGNAAVPTQKKTMWWDGFGGGGLACSNNCFLVLRDVLFERNRNDNYGTYGNPIVEDVKSASSGGLFLNQGCSIVATNVVFRNNDGGAVFMHNMKAAELQNLSLIGNRAIAYDGGAVHIHGVADEQTYKIVNLFATGNKSGQFGGGIHITGKGRYLLDHVTLVDNEGDNGGGLCIGGTANGTFSSQLTAITLSNSIIAGNRGKYVKDFDISTGETGTLNVSNCIISEFQSFARKKISQDRNNLVMPFADVKFGELTDFGNGIPVMPLLEGSPAIDAGSVMENIGENTGENTPLTDITGRPRNVGKAPDIGAFEFQSETKQAPVLTTRYATIFEAAQKGSVPDVEFFIKADKTAVNAKKNDGRTPLHEAAQHNPDVEVLKLLIANGADCHAKSGPLMPYDLADTQEKRNILLAAMKPTGRFVDLFEAAKSGTVKDCEFFLKGDGADVNAKNKKYYEATALHEAAKYNTDLEVIKYLVSRGANVNATNVSKLTPLHEAALTNSNEKIVEYLVDQGSDVNAKHVYGHTPLHCAALRNNNVEVLKSLIARGADVSVKDNDGKTALDIASTEEKKTILRAAKAGKPNLPKLSDDEKKLLQQKYPELDWTNANVIVLPEPTESELRKAFEKAAQTPENDFIVVRTTREKHKIVLKSDSFIIQHKAEENGSVAVIALGSENLVLDGDKKSRLFVVKDGAKADFAGIVFTNGRIVDGMGGGVYVNNKSTARFFRCDFIANACVPAQKDVWWKNFGGGGLMSDRSSSIVLRDVLFEGNCNTAPGFYETSRKEDAKFSWDSSGALLLLANSSLDATNVVFRNNFGGAMFLHEAKSVALRNISVIDNKSCGGGAVHLSGADAEQTYRIVNFFAAGNTSGEFGGGLHVGGKGRYVLDHLTLVDNQGDHGGGLALGGGGDYKIDAKEVVLSNSLIVGNRGKISPNFARADVYQGEFHADNCIVTESYGASRVSFPQEKNNRFLKIEDVKLGEMKDFGNGVPVMPLLEGSPAIDAGTVMENTGENTGKTQGKTQGKTRRRRTSRTVRARSARRRTSERSSINNIGTENHDEISSVNRQTLPRDDVFSLSRPQSVNAPGQRGCK